MNSKEDFYCLVLSTGQARFLATSKYGIDRMKALMSLVERAATADHEYEQKGFTTTVHIGQVVMSEVELSRLWKCDRKTVSKVLDTMNELGLVATKQNNRTSIHTLLCISAWYDEGQKIINPYYVPIKDRFTEEISTSVNNKVNMANGSADSATDTTKPEQIMAMVPGADVRSEGVPDTPQSISYDSTTIYNNVEDAEDSGCYTSGEAASGVYQRKGKEESFDSAPSSPDTAKSVVSDGVLSGDDADGKSGSVFGERVPLGVAHTPNDGKPVSDLTVGSGSDKAYHSIRDKVIDELNEMPK